jgi:hypothetical protein
VLDPAVVVADQHVVARAAVERIGTHGEHVVDDRHLVVVTMVVMIVRVEQVVMAVHQVREIIRRFQQAVREHLRARHARRVEGEIAREHRLVIAHQPVVAVAAAQHVVAAHLPEVVAEIGDQRA